MPDARYILVGGFLGAGKTTAILRLAEHLRGRGSRVGLITNDQSYGLVDTTMLASHGFPVEEISGGCFCCKFDSLVEASEKLSVEARPDVFIAEPVGSCTDLKATVDYPLRRMYGDEYEVAPLSVLVDPVRAMRILGLESGKSFSPKVVYIYTKQLEEAEIIVVNKADLLSADRLDALVTALGGRFPHADVRVMSARSGSGLQEWLARITTSAPRTRGAMPVDYQTYADGEALLGWLNATANVSADEAFDGNRLLRSLGQHVRDALREQRIEIAHLKMTLTPDEGGNDLAVANVVRGDATLELSHTLHEALASGELIMNLRAEGDPERLREVVQRAVDAIAALARLRLTIRHLECFRPGKPTPVHRLAGV